MRSPTLGSLFFLLRTGLCRKTICLVDRLPSLADPEWRTGNPEEHGKERRGQTHDKRGEDGKTNNGN